MFGLVWLNAADTTVFGLVLLNAAGTTVFGLVWLNAAGTTVFGLVWLNAAIDLVVSNLDVSQMCVLHNMSEAKLPCCYSSELVRWTQLLTRSELPAD